MCVTHCGKKCKTLEIYYASAAENLCKARTQIVQDKTQTVRQKIEQPEHKKSDRQPGMETSQSDSGARGMQVRVRTGQPEPSKVRESALNEAPFGSAGGGLPPPTK